MFNYTQFWGQWGQTSDQRILTTLRTTPADKRNSEIRADSVQPSIDNSWTRNQFEKVQDGRQTPDRCFTAATITTRQLQTADFTQNHILINSTKYCMCLTSNCYCHQANSSKHNSVLDSGTLVLWNENMTSSINQKYITCCKAVRGRPSHGHRQHAQEIGAVQPFELCKQTDRQTDKQMTYSSQCFARLPGAK